MYKQAKLRNFLTNNPFFKIQALEDKCEIPRGTIRHFIKERRDLPEDAFQKLEKILFELQYHPDGV